MQDNQKKAIEKNMTDLCNAIHPDLFFHELRMKSLLSQSERDIINKESTDCLTEVERSFFFLMAKPTGWQATIDFLEHYGLIPDTVKDLKMLGGELGRSEPQGIQAAVRQDLMQSSNRYLNTLKGLVMIINNKYFSPKSGLEHRNGSEQDYQKSMDLWHNLGYNVEWHSDLSAKDTYARMDDFAANPLQADYHSAVVVVMSHGVLGKIYGKNGGEVDIKKFVNKLNGRNCPALKDKPKMILFQACRERVNTVGCCGVRKDSAQSEEEITVEQIKESLSWLNDDQVHTDGISLKHAIVGFSTSKGKVQYRNINTGTYYIQAICKVFDAQHEQLHIQQLLDVVGQKVATEQNDQIATYEHSLDKKFFI